MNERSLSNPHTLQIFQIFLNETPHARNIGHPSGSKTTVTKMGEWILWIYHEQMI